MLNVEDIWWQSSPDRDFAWNAFQIGKWITEQEENITLDGVRVPNKTERFSVLGKEAFKVLGTLWLDHRLLPEPLWFYESLQHSSPDYFQTFEIAIFLREECRQFLILSRAGKQPDIPRLAQLGDRQRRYRRRENLPDPNRPAWATVNRNPSNKVQMPCRVMPEVKDLVSMAAEAEGISQARWLEEAIAQKLKAQGYDAEPPKRNARPKETPPTKPKRLQRPSRPRPEASPGIAANRADKPTTIRIGKSLAARIDQARGKELDRSAWMNRAIHTFMKTNGRLPEPEKVREAMSEPVSLRFDQDFFPQIEAAADAAGLTNSEWFRRVARWYLKEK